MDANRPDINPVNNNLVLYVGKDGHIHLWNISEQSDTDLSSLTGVGGASDEHPDWSPDGQAIVFDSSRTAGNNGRSMSGQTGNTVYVMTGVFTSDPATTANPAVSTNPGPIVSPRWSSLSSNTFAGSSQIEPVFAPNTTTASDSAPMLAWVNVKSGSNIDVSTGVSVNNPSSVDIVTATRSVNSMVDWQPLSPCSLTGSSCSDQQNTQAAINPGTLTITTPYTASNPFVLPAMTLSADGTYFETSVTFPNPASSAVDQIDVTSTLAPALGWTLSVAATNLTNGTGGIISSSGLGLTNGDLLDPGPGTAEYPGTVTFTNLTAENPNPSDNPPGAIGLSTTPRNWATATAADGTTVMDGTLTLLAPTSTPTGSYSGTFPFLSASAPRAGTCQAI